MTVKELKDYKTSLYSSLSRNLSEFEKNFLLISSALLAFTITFIKEIVKIESAICITLLYISWAFIIVSIGLMMIAFLKSSLASDELWKLVDEYLLKNNLFKDEKELSNEQIIHIKTEVNRVFYKNKKKLKILRFISVGTFLTGLTFLSFYISINLTHENQKINSNNYKTVSGTDTVEIKTANQSIKLIFKNENYESRPKTQDNHNHNHRDNHNNLQ